MKRWMIKLVVVAHIFLLLLMTGCWDNRDVSERAIIASFGLDKTEDGKIELTVQVALPSAFKGGQEAGGGGGGTAKKPFWVKSAIGETVIDASRNVHTIMNRRTFLSHVQLVIIGEKLAKEGLIDVLDFFERNHELNLLADVLIAKGTTAKKILNAESKMEPIPAMHMVGILKNNVVVGKFKRVKLFDFLQEMSIPGKGISAGTVEIGEDGGKDIENMKIQGVAIFKKDKMVGWLNPEETRGLLFTDGKIKSTILHIPHPINQEKKIAIEVIRSHSKKTVQTKGKDLSLSIELNMEGDIAEDQGLGDLTTKEMISRLEKDTEKAVRKDILLAMKAAQEKYKDDIFGFGDLVYQKHFKLWSVLGKDWDEAFSKIPVEIKTTFHIRRSGFTKYPLKPQ